MLSQARLMVKEKNADELFQNFMWHTHAVDSSVVKREPKAAVPLSPEKAKADSQQGILSYTPNQITRSLSPMFQRLITSGRFSPCSLLTPKPASSYPTFPSLVAIYLCDLQTCSVPPMMSSVASIILCRKGRRRSRNVTAGRRG